MPEPTHICPGGCGHTGVPRNHFACPACWGRLPFLLRKPILANHRRDLAAHAAAMREARHWYEANPVGPAVTNG